jgi:hypothetical protein
MTGSHSPRELFDSYSFHFDASLTLSLLCMLPFCSRELFDSYLLLRCSLTLSLLMMAPIVI